MSYKMRPTLNSDDHFIVYSDRFLYFQYSQPNCSCTFISVKQNGSYNIQSRQCCLNLMRHFFQHHKISSKVLCNLKTQ